MEESFKKDALALLDSAIKGFKNYNETNEFFCCHRNLLGVFHSIKGAAGMYGAKQLQEHAQRIENQVEAIAQKKQFSTEDVTYFLSAIETTRKFLNGEEVNAFDYDKFKDKEITKPITTSSSHKEVDNNQSGLVYIIDDEEMLLEVLEDALVEIGFKVKTFLVPDELLGMLEKESPDLILSDYNMPKMTGLELFAEIRKKNKHLAFVLISGYMTKEILIESYNLGASGFLEKPADPDDLEIMCRKAITNYRAFSNLDSELSDLSKLVEGIGEGNAALKSNLQAHIERISQQIKKL